MWGGRMGLWLQPGDDLELVGIWNPGCKCADDLPSQLFGGQAL